MNIFRRHIVSSRRILGRFKASEIAIFPIFLNAGYESTVLGWRHSEKSAQVSARFISISLVLKAVAASEIISAIIERIAVAVIAFFFANTPEYLTMHVNIHTAPIAEILTPYDVRITTAIVPLDAPVPLTKPYIVGGVNDCVLSLRKRDEAVRCVERLDNLVSLHGAFHRSSFKGLFEFSRYFSMENTVAAI
jgi:hypothetical protein